MPRIIILFFLAIILPGFCFGYTVSESGNFIFSVESYLRQDVVAFKNVVDLNTRRGSGDDDETIYFGIDYSVGLDLKLKDNGGEFYLKLERNGPYDYSAPLFVHNTLINSGGLIQKYRKTQLLPQIEEFWLDTPLFNNFGIKTGLYTYTVGNGFSLTGSYENYGFTFYRETENSCWRLYYCRPDASHKNPLGPRISQEKEQGIVYEHNAANFFSADIKFQKDNRVLHPYVGVLADYTSFGKRANSFAVPVDKDILGTIGASYALTKGKLFLNFEAAHNFGRAESRDASFKDVYHTGYLIYGEAAYQAQKANPFFRMLVSSGNKVSLDNAVNQDGVLTSGRNRAFSYNSPFNGNLSDSISTPNVDMLPIVAMGGGYGLNYGIRRPGTFVAGDFDNLIMPSLGADFCVTPKLTVGVYEYYLRAFEKGVGTLNGEGKFLSRDLGWETDVFVDYQLNKNILVSLLGGYYIPGRYYKEERDDTEGSLFSPFVRGGPKADPAFQIELAVETKF